MKYFYLILVVLCSVDSRPASASAMQDFSTRVATASLAGDWMDYINGPTVKAVMHLHVDASGALRGSIDWPGATQPMTMTNIHISDGGFVFTTAQRRTVAVSLSDDGTHLVGMGVWERVAAAVSHQCPTFNAASLRLDPDIQPLLDGIKPESPAETSKVVWCASAANINVLKEIMVSGSATKIRNLRKAQIALDEMHSRCPSPPPSATLKEQKAYSECIRLLFQTYRGDLAELMNKMRSLNPDPEDLETLHLEASFATDLAPLIAKQAQAEEKAGAGK